MDGDREWRLTIPNQFKNEKEINALERFLRGRVRKGNKIKANADGSFSITSPNKNEAFLVGGFIANENPLKRRLNYTVEAYADGRRIWSSERIVNSNPQQTFTERVRIRNGGITIPHHMRIRLYLADGDQVNLQMNGRKIVIIPSWVKEQGS